MIEHDCQTFDAAGMQLAGVVAGAAAGHCLDENDGLEGIVLGGEPGKRKNAECRIQNAERQHGQSPCPF